MKLPSRFLQADLLYPISKPVVPNGILEISNEGVVLSIYSPETFPYPAHKIERFKGILVPGFINTHCHLELSHLYNQIPKQCGLVGFIKKVIQLRNLFSEEEQLKKMEWADQSMKSNGIVAVADISNQVVSKKIKEKSTIHYHTFIEILGFQTEKATAVFANALELQEKFHPLKNSIVPHAPYSVSKALFDKIKLSPGLCSIHNQESAAENLLFTHKSGDFIAFYQSLGIDISNFEATDHHSLPSYLPYLNKEKKTLLVHNTFSDANDIEFAEKNHSKLYWCLCPNANLYIENTLPNIPLLIEKGCKITLGTDSLASNAQLSILSEMQVLQHHFDIPLQTLFEMATLNGASFLEMDQQLGSFEIGKKPGVLLIQIQNNQLQNNIKVLS